MLCHSQKRLDLGLSWLWQTARPGRGGSSNLEIMKNRTLQEIGLGFLDVQDRIAKAHRWALEHNNPGMLDSLEAFLKATPGRRALFTEGRLFKRSSAIMERRHWVEQKKVLDKDPRSYRIKRIDWTQVEFSSFLDFMGDEELPVKGDKKLALMKKGAEIRLDNSWAHALLKDYEEYGADSILEYLREEKNVTRMDFFGTITLYSEDPECPRDQSVTVLEFVEGNKPFWSLRAGSMSFLAEFDRRSLSPLVGKAVGY